MTLNTTACSFGDVVLVPFPFTDQSATKKRPAIVVSSDAYHRERQDVIVVAVTSRVASEPKTGDVTVSGWRDAGLLKPSVIKPVFTTIETGLLLRTLGTLGSADQFRLRTALQQVLG